MRREKKAENNYFMPRSQEDNKYNKNQLFMNSILDYYFVLFSASYVLK
jgi:hypothetical protein